MKNKLIFVLVLILSFSLMVSCSKREVDGSKIQVRNNLAYVVNEDETFTGEATTYYANGQIKNKVNFKDGKLNGQVIVYYENGEVKIRENCKDGKTSDENAILYYKNEEIKIMEGFLELENY